MINEAFVKCWEEHQYVARQILEGKSLVRLTYRAVVEVVIQILNQYMTTAPRPSAQFIHHIMDGGLQGMNIFVVGEDELFPQVYWYIRIESRARALCGGAQQVHTNCIDTDHVRYPFSNLFEVDQYMALAADIVRDLRVMDDGVF